MLLTRILSGFGVELEKKGRSSHELVTGVISRLDGLHCLVVYRSGDRDIPSMATERTVRGAPKRRIAYTGAFTYIGPPKNGAPNQHIVQAPDGSRHDVYSSPEGATPDEVIEHAPQLVSSELEYRQSVRENLVMAVAMTAGLPAVLFVIGWAVLWIGRGFRKS